MSRPASNDPNSWKNQLVRRLTYVQHASGSFISLFVTVHISAPIVANLGGSMLSSSAMLLGREYYQGPITEPLLVYGPIVLHLGSALLKHLLVGFPRRPSLLHISAWPLTIFVPIHFATHRLFPSSNAPSIQALSPGELDYEYVKYGLQVWPKLNTFIYMGLVTSVMVHTIEGGGMLMRSYVVGSGKRTWGVMRKTLFVMTVGSVAGAIWALSREPLFASPLMIKRFRAAWTQLSPIYRIQ